MGPALHSMLGELGIGERLIDILQNLIGHLDLVRIGTEAAVILLVGLLGYALSGRLRRAAVAALPLRWGALPRRAAESITMPLFWLVGLWLVLLAWQALDYKTGLINVVASLLLAWVVIRLLSFAVRNPTQAATISVFVWGFAALNILGLLTPLARQLDSHAIMLGKLRVSALSLVHGILVLLLLLWVTHLLANFIEGRIHTARTLTPSIKALLVRFIRLLLPIFAVIVALNLVGIDLTVLTVFSGALGIGVGLGLQRLVANLVAGITLIAGKSVKPGDIIAYKNSYGWVTFMGARYVAIATRDGSEYLVPNEEFINNAVENWSYSNPNRRLHIPLGIAYESDLHAAIALCVEAAQSVERILKTPVPTCLVTEFAESSVNLEIRAWINDPVNGVASVRSAVLLAVWDRFAAAGIRIPYPQRDIHVIPTPPGA
jgi:small-conductance mechanosensitive channel